MNWDCILPHSSVGSACQPQMDGMACHFNRQVMTAGLADGQTPPLACLSWRASLRVPSLQALHGQMAYRMELLRQRRGRVVHHRPHRFRRLQWHHRPAHVRHCQRLPHPRHRPVRRQDPQPAPRRVDAVRLRGQALRPRVQDHGGAHLPLQHVHRHAGRVRDHRRALPVLRGVRQLPHHHRHRPADAGLRECCGLRDPACTHACMHAPCRRRRRRRRLLRSLCVAWPFLLGHFRGARRARLFTARVVTASSG